MGMDGLFFWADLIHIELDRAYIRWRITRHPLFRYGSL